MRQTRVVVVGSANMDLVGTGPALPRPGETVLGSDFVMVPGGKGANQAIAAVRAGASGVFLGALGSDAFGVTLRARITAAGVDTGQLRVVYGASGVALVMVNTDGENAILVTPGANASFLGLTDGELDAVRQADVLVAQVEIPVETVTAAAVAARQAGTRVILNAAPARPLPDELLAAVDLLVVNETEAQALTGRGRDEPEALLELVPRAVLTLGGEGAWYVDRDGGATHVPAVKVDVVDSTAAGDAFTAALAVAWGEGREVLDAVRWAAAAGAACVRRLGASVALPHRAEIDALYTPPAG
ncbi:ribokinase [Micromonospora halophytica]|uniref:Ribokinase n=1 Tax=Micromonospora halophytica TaxID=47864 RepID=A0A1C5J915_9ACTN|nr:ribokinase [Micromonospora halophytica]SCG66741.1 ribokinase [Micromonospora halophytica]